MSLVDAGLLAAVRERLAQSGSEASTTAVADAVRELGVVVDRPLLARLTAVVGSEADGLGPLDGLAADPAVTDVLVNGHHDAWIDRGRGLERAAATFQDEAAVRALAVRLAARAGRRLDDACPFVDARLPGGQRLHAVIPPLSVHGTTISLRIPSRQRFGIDDLVAAGTVDPDGARWLAGLVACRASFLVSGGTGTGKTTVLAALLGLVGSSERIVVVEDTCELRPDHPHVVSLESRVPNVEGRGGVALHVLVRQALRMRPDRLVVGEVRGAEVVDLLAALNTGHEGGCGTIHANSAGSVPARLVALGLAAGMARAGVHAQIAAGIEAIVHLRRDAHGRRVVDQVGVVAVEGDVAVVRPALVRRDGALHPGPGMAMLAERVSGGAGA